MVYAILAGLQILSGLFVVIGTVVCVLRTRTFALPRRWYIIIGLVIGFGGVCEMLATEL